MDLNRVAVFARVVEGNGFTAAAKALGLPKSSVSRAVTLLEAELGVRLLQRSTRKVSLTEAGSAFYERAARGLAGVEEAALAVADMQGALRGPIRMTSPADAGDRLLGPALARFLRRHPRVQVELVLTGRIVDLVAEGFDLALRAGHLRDGSLIARKVGDTAGGVFASPRYLSRHGEPARLDDLAAHRCVLFRPTRGRSVWTLKGPAGEEHVEVRGPLGADDLSFVRRALLGGPARTPAAFVPGLRRAHSPRLPLVPLRASPRRRVSRLPDHVAERHAQAAARGTRPRAQRAHGQEHRERRALERENLGLSRA
ncbi:MAG: LysR family transcriptional regulator [Polyangiaceae bacterium]|nr:LysR family transcriptional regulator [Polyangiaceae bacterium]